MGKKLKKITLENGTTVEEKGCGNYICRYCGGRGTACNFVAGLCLQVYAKHYGLCGAYLDSEKYKGYVTECSTCQFQVNGECTFEEEASAAK